jgi:hypothetical protein
METRASTQPHPPNYTRETHQPTALFSRIQTACGKNLDYDQLLLISFLLFFFLSLILLFTLMVCCDGNSLVKIRRNGKQRMEEGDHQGTDKGAVSLLPYIVSQAQRVRGGGTGNV